VFFSISELSLTLTFKSDDHCIFNLLFQAQGLLSRFEDYLKENPRVAMIDSIETIRTMIDRFKTYTLIQDCDFETEGEVLLL